MVDKERLREIRCHIRGVYELLERGASEASICDYLRNIEVDRMEMVDV